MTTVMFVMQACYGSPNVPPEIPDETELTDEALEAEAPVTDSIVEAAG